MLKYSRKQEGVIERSIDCLNNTRSEGREEVLEGGSIDYCNIATRAGSRGEEGAPPDLNKIDRVFRHDTVECAVMQFA
jgi:hypothetical protein